MNKKNERQEKNRRDLSNEKSYLIILFFVIIGFVVIMTGILNNALAQNKIDEPSKKPINVLTLESKAKNIVTSSIHFTKYSDGNLIYEGRQNLGSEGCWRFFYKFRAENLNKSLEEVESFHYTITYERGQLKVVDVYEIIS